MSKFLIPLILIFYFLALLQSSFLVHLLIFGFALNISLILVILINIFEASQKNLGLYSALMAGFCLDIFSTRLFGFWILIFLATAIFVKLIFRKHVRVPFTN